MVSCPSAELEVPLHDCLKSDGKAGPVSEASIAKLTSNNTDHISPRPATRFRAVGGDLVSLRTRALLQCGHKLLTSICHIPPSTYLGDEAQRIRMFCPTKRCIREHALAHANLLHNHQPSPGG